MRLACVYVEIPVIVEEDSTHIVYLNSIKSSFLSTFRSIIVEINILPRVFDWCGSGISRCTCNIPEAATTSSNGRRSWHRLAGLSLHKSTWMCNASDMVKLTEYHSALGMHGICDPLPAFDLHSDSVSLECVC